MALILVIDDDGFYRNVIGGLLGGAGHAVIEAENGKEGVAAYRDRHPDLVIVDLFLPDIDGCEVMQEILAEDRQARLIAISGQAALYDAELARTVKGMGAAAILRKLDSKDRVLAEIDWVLKAPPAQRAS
jgi:CheY-like chemotaxis protein